MAALLIIIFGPIGDFIARPSAAITMAAILLENTNKNAGSFNIIHCAVNSRFKQLWSLCSDYQRQQKAKFRNFLGSAQAIARVTTDLLPADPCK